MTEPHSIHLESLIQEVSRYSPSSPPLLEQLCEKHGQKSAYYAAFILVYLQAKYENDGYVANAQLTWENFRDYAFYEEAQDNPAALAMLNTILAAFHNDIAAKAAKAS